MSTTITAKFDGKVFLPESPVDLKPQTRYVLRVEQELPATEEKDGWEVIESLIGSVQGPPDLSLNHDHYLYGLPKKPELK
jgi:hypothetical protein